MSLSRRELAPGLPPSSSIWQVGNSRGRLACRRVNRVIVGIDKFRQDINISVLISIRKIFIESIANRAMHAFHYRTFQVGVPANLILDAFVPQHVLKMLI